MWSAKTRCARGGNLHKLGRQGSGFNVKSIVRAWLSEEDFVFRL